MRQPWMAVACALALALGGCNVAEAVMTDTLRTISRVDLNKAQIALMQDNVRKSLKDPGSAQFGTYAAGVNKEGNVLVCGLVNAKNSYGGYTGMSPFAGIFQSGTFLVGGIESGTGDDVKMRFDLCDAQGLPLPR